MPEHGVARTTSWRTGFGALLAAAAVLSGVALAPSAGAAPTSRPPATAVSATAPSAPGIVKQISCSGLADIATTSTKKHVCSHGGDPAPAGAAVGTPRALPFYSAAGTAGAGSFSAAAGAGITCYGDGITGQRVQAVYARNADVPDRFSSVSAAISSTYAGQVESVFAASAAETGGIRHVRWVTGAGCTLSVLNVVLPAGTPTTFDATINAMDAMGYNAPDRKYLIWMDATALCGIATVFPDDQPGLANASVGTGWARIDSGCWGLDNHTVEAHELMHTLGSVENTSPHHTAYGHCTDGNELMCYVDGAGTVLTSVCPASHANLFDCNHDDYFSATQPAPGNYLATHWNTATSPWLATTAPDQTAALGNGHYHALTPVRLLDTRDGTGSGGTPLGAMPPGSTLTTTVAGTNGVPSRGVAAVVLNVTVTGPGGGGFLTVFPSGQTRPTVSNLNYGAGQTVANLVVATVGSGGAISVFSNGGSPNVIIDLAGWFADSSGTWSAAGTYHALTPVRALDTRTTIGGHPGALGAGQSLDVQVSPFAGVPTGASAVVLNVTAVTPSRGGFLTAWPAGGARPLASNLNFVAGQVVPNLVIATVGTGGKVSVFNFDGNTDLVVDIAGYFDTAGSIAGGGSYHALTPARILDTRDGTGGPGGAVGAGTTRALTVEPAGGVPSTGVSAVIMNTTVTGPTADGFLTVYPSTATRPTASNLNFVAGQTVPNLVIATVGSTGQLGLYNLSGNSQVIGDVSGWFDAG